MAAFDFPSSPSNGDTYNLNGVDYTYNGTVWKKTSSGNLISDGDRGDVVVSNSGETFTIDNESITYTKIQNVSSTDRVLGRDTSGAGEIEEITPSNLRTMINVADGAEVNVNADWNSSSGDSQILNKPTVPSNIGDLGNVSNSTPSANQVLKWNGSVWSPAEDNSGSGATDLSNTANGTSLTIESSSGNNTSLPAATTSAWGVMTDDDKSKLDAIEPSADVTDETNVNAAGAVMNSDLDGKGELLVGDGSGDPTALGVGTNGYVLKANSSTATGLEWSAAGSGGDANQNAFSTIAVSGQSDVAADNATDTLNIAAGSNVTVTTNASSDTVTISSTDTNTTYSVGDGGLSQNNFTDALKNKLDGISASANVGLTNLVGDTTPQLGGDLDMNSKFISSGILGVKNTGTQSELRLYCESSNAHYASIKAPAHADFSGNITYTLPSAYGSNGQVLKSNGSGGLDWVDQSGGGATDKISEGNTEAETVDTGSDGHFKVTTEGTERLRVAANGNVGIGSSTPGELLQIYDASGNPTIHVRANNQNTASLKFENDDGDWTISSGTSSYPLKFAVGGSDKFTILNDGKVGIGTTSPSTVLEVNGSFKAGGLAYPTSDGSANQVLKTDGSGTLSFVDQSGGGGGGGLSSDSQYNTVGGTNAGDSFTGTDAEGNTLIGYDAGTAITTADDNTCLGFDAGKALTTGGSNTFVGAEVGETCTTGSQNICVGRRSGQSLTTGFNNIFIGRQAGQNTTEGNDNVSIGTYALLNNQTGIRNTVVGSNSGRAITTGTESCFFGAYAGYSLTTGSHNNSFGYQAGYSLISGAHNNFYGKQSGYNCTTGHRNTGYGNNTLLALTTGQRNTGIGYSSGKDLTTGYYNTFLGYYAGNNTTTGENNICIGYQATTSSATVDNEVTIGDSNVTKFRIPGLNFVVKDSTATNGHVLTVDANGEAGFAAASGGGGSLEYVSTTTISSDNSTAQIDLTSLDTNAIYKIIARKIKFSGSGSTLRIRFLDSSGNYQSNINYWREKGRDNGQEFSNQNYIMCDTDGSTQYMSFIAELHTPAIFNWLYFNGYPPQEQDNRCDIYASFSSSNTSGTINGIRFYMESGYYFQSGTEILLYKYKMS
tara:strand:+ start:3686 stop:7027 length:3342 start_codon:yes stop_codon:yes gene_type:complete